MSSDPKELPKAIEATLQLYENGQRAQASEMWYSLVVQTTGLTAALARQCIELTEQEGFAGPRLRLVIVEASQSFDSMEIEALSWELADDDLLGGGGDVDGGEEFFVDDFLLGDEEESGEDASEPITGIFGSGPFDPLDEEQTLEFERDRPQRRPDSSGFAPPLLDPRGPGVSSPGFELADDLGESASGSTLMGRRGIDTEPVDAQAFQRSEARVEVASAPPPWARGGGSPSNGGAKRQARRPSTGVFAPRKWPSGRREATPLELEPVSADVDAPPPWGDAAAEALPDDFASAPMDWSEDDKPQTLDAIPIPDDDPLAEWDRPHTIHAEPIDDDEPLLDWGSERPQTLDAVPILEDETTARAMRPVTVDAEPIPAEAVAGFDDDPWADVAAALQQEEGERQKLHARHAERRRGAQERSADSRRSSRQPTPTPANPSPVIPRTDEEPPSQTLKRRSRLRTASTPIANPKVHFAAGGHSAPEPPPPSRGRRPQTFTAEATPARGTAPPPPASAAAQPATPTPAPPESTAVSAETEALEQSKRLLQEGDVVGGFLVVEQILKRAPENYEAIYLANTLRERLKSNALEMLDPLERCPNLLVPIEAIYGLRGIDHRAGFLLSQIDGMASIEFLIHSGAMPSEDAALLLLTLKRRDIINLG